MGMIYVSFFVVWFEGMEVCVWINELVYFL